MAQFNKAFEESLRADGASRQKSINSSTLRDVITNRSPDDYKEGGQSKINSALRFYEKAGILDMTVGQLADDPVAFVNAMTGDAYDELGKNQANSASKFIASIFQDAGHGKAWGSNTLKRELNPVKAKELFPIEATQTKVKGYPDDFFIRTKKAVTALQNAGQKEAAAQLLLTMLGGYRSADVTGIKVEDIDFRTGVIFDVTVKGAGEVVDKTGVLSAPMLDVIKDYLGDRADGLLFEDPKANATIINKELKKQFPQDYLTKKSKEKGTYKSGISLYDYRHFNETYLSSMDVSPELRKVATLRAAADVAEKYAASGARRADVNSLHSGLLAVFSAGSGSASPAQFLNDTLAVQIGVNDNNEPIYNQPKLSDKTKRIVPTKQLLEKIGYEDAISPNIYASLPEEGNVVGSTAANIDPETTAAINRQVQSEATEAALQSDVRAGEIADDAAAARAKVAETKAEAKAQQKTESLDTTKSKLLSNVAKVGRPILKVVAPPVGYGLAALAADQTRSAVVNSSLANQARDLGIPEGAIQTAGAVAGATEFLPITPTDVISVAQSIPTEPSMMQEARMRQESRQFDFGDEFGNIDPDTGQAVPTAPVNIPDPAPSAPDMAAQGFVPVPEARANAMRGEATAMDQAPSFLYGGVVR